MLGAKHTTIGCMGASASGALDRGVIRDVAVECLQPWNQQQGNDRGVDSAVRHEIQSRQSRDEKTYYSRGSCDESHPKDFEQARRNQSLPLLRRTPAIFLKYSF
jgi:hypothetical protein